jgi:D-amino-acid dehydrogenase
MSEGLRIAGTVEFAAADDPPAWCRADRLRLYAQRYLGSDQVPDNGTRWIGSRPSLPDSLPAIGRDSVAAGIFYAFGHQHLGLTQAAITAEATADLVCRKPPAIDLRPYRLERFGKITSWPTLAGAR